MANLTALARRTDSLSAGLHARLESLGPWTGTSPRSRNGQELPSCPHGNGRRALESGFDAVAEAHRWANEVKTGSALIVLGGAGPAVWLAVLERNPSLVLVVEPRAEVWQNLFTLRDFTDCLSQSHWYAACADPDQWLTWISGRYHPLWDGSLELHFWRAATMGEERWERHQEAFARAVGSWSGDFSTQARFGARWYRNSLVNLSSLQPLGRGNLRDKLTTAPEGCIVAGAGPSLELALADKKNQTLLAGRPGNGWLLLSTDTALPALLLRGYTPDLVLCLDGQLPSAQHFHSPLPRGLPLLADLAALPLFHRLGLKVLPFLSGNPLGPVIRRFFPGLPQLDSASGNVSGLGLVFSAGLGARKTLLWGADLSYPHGKGYARGTYPYALQGQRTNRCSPLETRLGSACYGATDLRVVGTEKRYTTPLLREYRERMMSLSAGLRTNLKVVTTTGFAPFPSGLGSQLPNFVPFQGPGDASGFRLHWSERLSNLPRLPKGERMMEFLSRLSHDQQEDWLALWPLALAIHRVEGSQPDWQDRLVERALEPFKIDL